MTSLETSHLRGLSSHQPSLHDGGDSPTPVLTAHSECSLDKWLSNLNAHHGHPGHLFWGPSPELLTQDLQGVAPRVYFSKGSKMFQMKLP